MRAHTVAEVMVSLANRACANKIIMCAALPVYYLLIVSVESREKITQDLCSCTSDECVLRVTPLLLKCVQVVQYSLVIESL